MLSVEREHSPAVSSCYDATRSPSRATDTSYGGYSTRTRSMASTAMSVDTVQRFETGLRLELDLSEERIKELEMSYEDLTAKLNAAQQQLAAKAAEHAAEVERLHQEHGTANAEAQASLLSAERKLEELEKDRASLRAAADLAGEQLRQAEEKAALLATERDAASAKQAEVLNQYGELSLKVHQAESQQRELIGKLATSEVERQKLQCQFDESKRDLVDVTSQLLASRESAQKVTSLYEQLQEDTEEERRFFEDNILQLRQQLSVARSDSATKSNRKQSTQSKYFCSVM